jgi:fermentation-respiration switch protein FrsA (DUF1100 family)
VRVPGGAALLLALAGAFVLVLWPLLRHRATYPGGKLSPAEGDPSRWGLVGAETVRLVTEDGVALHGWWIPSRSGGAACGAVVYFHGNANTIAPRAWLGQRLAGRGLDVLLFDYRGYGLSEGRPTEAGLRRDARAAWSHVVEDRGIPPERLVLFGNSLGSAVATGLALERPAAALVLGAPFPDFRALVRHHAPWLPLRVLPWRDGRYPAGSRIGELDLPVLVALGEADQVVPAGLSREVYDAAREPRRLVATPAEHNTLIGHPAVWRALDELLGERLGCGRPGGSAPATAAEVERGAG